MQKKRKTNVIVHFGECFSRYVETGLEWQRIGQQGDTVVDIL